LGGSSVAVGPTVGSTVGEGVLVLVGVSVMVGVAVGAVTIPVDCSMRKINAAPKPRIRIINPIAAGRLNFNSGSFEPWMGLAVTFVF
jgi:hypothetical protein